MIPNRWFKQEIYYSVGGSIDSRELSVHIEINFGSVWYTIQCLSVSYIYCINNFHCNTKKCGPWISLHRWHFLDMLSHICSFYFSNMNTNILSAATVQTAVQAPPSCVHTVSLTYPTILNPGTTNEGLSCSITQKIHRHLYISRFMHFYIHGTSEEQPPHIMRVTCIDVSLCLFQCKPVHFSHVLW